MPDRKLSPSFPPTSYTAHSTSAMPFWMVGLLLFLSLVVWTTLAFEPTRAAHAQEPTPAPTPADGLPPWELPVLRKLYGEPGTSLQGDDMGAAPRITLHASPATAPAAPPASPVRPHGDGEPARLRFAEDRAKNSATITPTVTPTATPEGPRLTALAAPLRPPADDALWDSTEPYRYVSETGHNIGLAIKQFYDEHGGIAVFGLPLTEVLHDEAAGLQVQYFERARIELHADRPVSLHIELTRSGALLTEGRTEPAFTPLRHAPSNDRSYFTETGFRVGGKFRDFWQEHGGVRVLGYPISREFMEAIDGTRRPVQYFERARLEYHAEHAGTPRVIQIGRLGAALAEAYGVSENLRAPTQPIVKLSSATTTFRDSAGTRNATIAAQRLNGHVIEPGATLSFLDAIGELSEQTGYTAGTAIVNGQIVPIVAGGICQTSTTLYRAAFYAGLGIAERHAHSLYIAAFNDILSLDAAVYSPGLDLRIVNDTSGPVLVTATGDNGQITVELWGQDDGRTTQMLEPEVRSVLPPEPPIWRYDPALAADATEHEVEARDGMEITLRRIVTAADGATLHEDRFLTLYNPVTAVVRYGAAVTPPEDARVEGELPPTPEPTPEPTGEASGEPTVAPDPSPEAAPTVLEPPADVHPTVPELPTHAPPAEPAPEQPATPTPAPVTPPADGFEPPAESAPEPPAEEPAEPDSSMGVPPDTLIQYRL